MMYLICLSCTWTEVLNDNFGRFCVYFSGIFCNVLWLDSDWAPWLFLGATFVYIVELDSPEVSATSEDVFYL